MLKGLAPLVIRDGEASDLPFLMEQLAALAELEGLPMTATADDLHGLLFGEHAIGNVCIAAIVGKRLGGAIWHLTPSTFAGRSVLFIEDLFVVESWRHKRIGTRLLQSLAQSAKALNCCAMQWLRATTNHEAGIFYRKHSAVEWPGWECGTISGSALDQLAADRSVTV